MKRRLLNSVAHSAMPLPKIDPPRLADILAYAYRYLGLTHLGDAN